MSENAPLAARLIAANRVLIDLDAIDEFRNLSLSAMITIREAQRVLAELREQSTEDLTLSLRRALQDVIDRLEARLHSLGRSA
jgi:hypothetical protein